MKTFSILALVAIAGSAQAGVFGTDLGTGAPPATIGGYSMTSFGTDPTAPFTDVTSVASPLGGSVGFDSAFNRRTIGSGWASWSHGYTGDVYYSNGGSTLTMTLPANTGAFSFYAEPNNFGIYQIDATTQAGDTISTLVDGQGGANGYGIWADSGDTLTSVSISVDPAAAGFAVGEFAIAAVPAPSSLALLGLGGLVAGRRRR